MDGPGPLLSALRAALAPFDDDALAALASKGLVRRARKDLETIRPSVLGPDGEGDGDGDRLRVEVGDARASLALPPTRSSCTCPAGGVCRHVLAALIFVRESAAGPGDPPPPPAISAMDEVLAVDDEALSGWAGKALVARASKALAFGPAAEVEEVGGVVVVRFPGRNVTCRWMPGGGLDGTVCSCHAPGPCEHRVAAVLAARASRGARGLAAAAASALEASSEAPRTRDEVRASLGAVLAGLVTSGTARLSRATAERLHTLAVSAHGVDLPRLERLVRTLADEVEQTLARHAQADAPRLLGVAARAEVLRVALARPTFALVGEHRSTYEPVGGLELIGLGARAWRSRSGYAGLTVYFWDRSARAWSTWTDARPTAAGVAFDPRARYGTGGPWAGLPSPAHASRNGLRLTGAFRNRSGRLSGRPSTVALLTGPSDPAGAPAVDRWPQLVDRAAILFGGGFRDRSEGDALVRLAPSGWLPAAFDPVRQAVVRPVVDADGRSLPLVLPHTPEAREAVAALETFAPTGPVSLLGLLKLDAGRLAVEPIALHTGAEVVNLTLDTLKTVPSRRLAVASPAAADAEGDEPDADFDDPPSDRPSTRLGALLDRLAGLLESIGEGGLAAFRGLDELRAVAARLDALGLSTCARPAARVVAHLERRRRGDADDPCEAALSLLRAYHVARLALAHESIAAATSGL